MLRKFSVRNYRGFKNELVLDLSRTRDYAFNSIMVKDNLVREGIIYGNNGAGKSNLGLALFDIVGILTDYTADALKLNYATNADNMSNLTEFKYEFQFDDVVVTYEYGKIGFRQIVYERLKSGGNIIFDFDMLHPGRAAVFNLQGEAGIVFKDYLEFKRKTNVVFYEVAILKYIKSRLLTHVFPISEIMNFVDGMLLVKSSLHGNTYVGRKHDSESLTSLIIRSGKVRELEMFLKAHGLYYDLEVGELNGMPEIFARFNGRSVPLFKVISSGTITLVLYFYWSLEFRKLTFLFMDEFDAFYHFRSAAAIVNELKTYANMQVLLTTHNTYLMRNEIARPDALFIIDNNSSITSIPDLTSKEIREGHNVEKLYRNDAFSE